MKHLLVVLFIVTLTGCVTPVKLPTDHGREEFLKGDYSKSRISLGTAEAIHHDFSRESTMGLTMKELEKLVTLGKYTPMYRDVISAYFYMALDSLAQNNPSQARAALDKMLKVHDQIQRQYGNPEETINELSDETKKKDLDEVKGLIPDDDPKKQNTLAQYAKTWETAKRELERTDRTFDNQITDFYNQAAIILAAFLGGWSNTPSGLELLESCIPNVLGHAPATLAKLTDYQEQDNGFQNKLLVIIAAGQGPKLISKSISLKDIPGKKKAMEALQGFNPVAPIRISADSDFVFTEVATEMYTNLNAEFQKIKGRLLREQLIRVFLRDALVIGTTTVLATQYSKMAWWLLGLWAIGRQYLMDPEQRCLQSMPWAYQVALLEIPQSRSLTLTGKSINGNIVVPIPATARSGVLYVNLPGLNAPPTVKLFPLSIGFSSH